jgi:hypothetical protein
MESDNFEDSDEFSQNIPTKDIKKKNIKESCIKQIDNKDKKCNPNDKKVGI